MKPALIKSITTQDPVPAAIAIVRNIRLGKKYFGIIYWKNGQESRVRINDEKFRIFCNSIGVEKIITQDQYLQLTS